MTNGGTDVQMNVPVRMFDKLLEQTETGRGVVDYWMFNDICPKEVRNPGYVLNDADFGCLREEAQRRKNIIND